MGQDGRKVALISVTNRLMSQRRVTVSGCWEWTGALTMHGYGRMSWRGHVHRVHRIAAALWIGLNIEDSSVKVCHTCDNPLCFNPEHLYLGTQKTNVADMHARGRAGDTGRPQESCLKGHPLAGDNVKVSKRGGRRCRQCANDYQTKWRNDHIDEARARDRERWIPKTARALGVSA